MRKGTSSTRNPVTSDPQDVPDLYEGGVGEEGHPLLCLLESKAAELTGPLLCAEAGEGSVVVFTRAPSLHNQDALGSIVR